MPLVSPTFTVWLSFSQISKAWKWAYKKDKDPFGRDILHQSFFFTLCCVVSLSVAGRSGSRQIQTNISFLSLPLPIFSFPTNSAESDSERQREVIIEFSYLTLVLSLLYILPVFSVISSSAFASFFGSLFCNIFYN